ncbi:MAG: hypothetical protein ABEI57_02325 [Halapricum sp.]
MGDTMELGRDTGEQVEHGAVKHLERALECSQASEKNFHVRQALQLLVEEPATR